MILLQNKIKSAGMVKLVYTLSSDGSAFRRAGSNPATCTKCIEITPIYWTNIAMWRLELQ